MNGTVVAHTEYTSVTLDRFGFHARCHCGWESGTEHARFKAVLAGEKHDAGHQGRYPRTLADGTTVWACCESSIGPACQHQAPPS